MSGCELKGTPTRNTPNATRASMMICRGRDVRMIVSLLSLCERHRAAASRRLSIEGRREMEGEGRSSSPIEGGRPVGRAPSDEQDLIRAPQEREMSQYSLSLVDKGV